MRKIPTLTNNRESKVLVFKEKNLQIKKEYVLVWILPVPRENHRPVTDKLYHIMSYRVKEYTSIPCRGRGSNYKLSADRH